MGVNGLQTIINAFAENSIKYRQYKNYRGTYQSLDASVTLYRFCIGLLNTQNFKSQDGKFVGHLIACMNTSLRMLNSNIKPIWVFDGPPPNIKNKTLTKRRHVRHIALLKLNGDNLNDEETNRLQKKAFNITAMQINEIKYLLTLMGLPFIESPGEAEAQCAALNIAGISNGVVSEDWDVILFGCKIMLKNFSNKSQIMEINISELMKSLNMTREQFINLGSILGNDYCGGIGGLKPIEAYTKFKACNFELDKLISLLKHDKQYHIPDNFKEQTILSKDYYLHAPVIDPQDINVNWKKPNYEKLYDYLVDDKKLKHEFVTDKITELKMIYGRHSNKYN